MTRGWLVLLMTLSTIGAANGRAAQDRCHVYAVDVAAAKRALELSGDEQAQIKAMKAAETMFPEFVLTPKEEELTTKHFRLPGSTQVITASVYYTDESMASAEGSDSIIVGVAVGPREIENAVAFPAMNSSIAETVYGGHTGKVRAKQYVKINGKLFLVGIECDCGVKSPPQW